MPNNENMPTKINLKIFAGDETLQFQMLLYMALTFRAHIPLLAELTDYDKETIYSWFYFKVQSKIPIKSLDYLFNIDTYPQDKAREKLLNFYRKYIGALKIKEDDDKRKNMLAELKKQIFDNDAIKVQNEHKHNVNFTKEEIYAILKFKVKYALKDYETEKSFHIRLENYKDIVESIFNDDPDLYFQYESLQGYNESMFPRGTNAIR